MDDHKGNGTVSGTGDSHPVRYAIHLNAAFTVVETPIRACLRRHGH
jgi:hypothetical protein